MHFCIFTVKYEVLIFPRILSIFSFYMIFSCKIPVLHCFSLQIPVFTVKTKTDNPYDVFSYGYAFTNGDLDSGLLSLAEVLPDMMRLAEQENAAQLLAAEIEKTRRRVNALEHVLIPDTQETIRYIVMKLDENERANTTRLMKIKDMMIEETIRQKNPS